MFAGTCSVLDNSYIIMFSSHVSFSFTMFTVSVPNVRGGINVVFFVGCILSEQRISFLKIDQSSASVRQYIPTSSFVLYYINCCCPDLFLRRMTFCTYCRFSIFIIHIFYHIPILFFLLKSCES